MKKLFNALGQFFGFLTILLYAFLFINAIFNFNVPAEVMVILQTIQMYAMFVVCGLAGFEFVSGKKILALVYFLLLALVVVFSFFPDLRDQIIQIVTTVV
jgi:hypothetical protein